MRQYLAVLNRRDWCDTARGGLDPTSEFFAWFAANAAARLQLQAFTYLTGGD
ncbi:hypothetical protein [Micromonospora sp. NPDC049282]|uniref:hypothetical protein n=1 Tax=Micromonospora sp. NPDC049282 TaxID=3364269 RepID=UPI003715FA55